MLRAKQVLIPIDFSATMEPLLAYALPFALEIGVEEVHFVHSISTDSGPFPFDLTRDVAYLKYLRDQDAAASLESLAEIRQTYAAKYPFKMHHACLTGKHVGEAIVEYTHQKDIDLIIMGGHGHRGFQRYLLGSVADEVVQGAHCPVLTFRMHEGDWLPNGKISKVLVSTDFSEMSCEGLAVGYELAKTMDASLTLLHVVDQNAPITNGGQNHDAPDNLKERLALFCEETLHTCEGIVHEVRSGLPMYEIAMFAQQNSIDLIVMATHGNTGYHQFLMGSVTERVIRMATCPVLTLKSYGKSILDTKTSLALTA